MKWFWILFFEEEDRNPVLVVIPLFFVTLVVAVVIVSYFFDNSNVGNVFERFLFLKLMVSFILYSELLNVKKYLLKIFYYFRLQIDDYL